MDPSSQRGTVRRVIYRASYVPVTDNELRSGRGRRYVDIRLALTTSQWLGVEQSNLGRRDDDGGGDNSLQTVREIDI